MGWMRESDDPLVLLEAEHEIAAAKLSVAEDLSWFLALALGSIVGFFSHWLIGVTSVVAVFYCVTLPYRKKDKEAQDKYFRAAGIGAYSRAAGYKQ